MRYFSIDIETTGLDPEKDQILEIGIIYDDLNKKRREDELKGFHCYIEHERTEGNIYAICLNNKILERIKNKEKGYLYLKKEGVVEEILDFLRRIKYNNSDRMVLAGKNVASFDLKFLERLPGWKENIKVHHRVLDPGMLYVTKEDEVPPDLKKCKVRAGFSSVEVSHTALEDALDVVNLLRAKLT